MAQSKCPVCKKIKGRRICLIEDLNMLICSRCCAEMRNSSQCSDCEHFHRTETIAHKKESLSRNFSIEKEHPEIETQLEFAISLLEQGLKSQGQDIIDQFAKDHSNLATVQYALGVLCSLENNHAKARTHFQRAVDIYPYFTNAWYNLGHACLKTHDLITPIQCYRKVIDLASPSDDSYKQAQKSLSHQARIINQEHNLTLDQYVEMMTLYNSSFKLMENQRFEEAKVGFLTVLKNTSNRHYQSWGNLGLCHAYTNKREEALAAYDKALEISPDYKVVINNRKILLDLPDGEGFSDLPYQTIEYFGE